MTQAIRVRRAHCKPRLSRDSLADQHYDHNLRQDQVFSDCELESHPGPGRGIPVRVQFGRAAQADCICSCLFIATSKGFLLFKPASESRFPDGPCRPGAVTHGQQPQKLSRRHCLGRRQPREQRRGHGAEGRTGARHHPSPLPFPPATVPGPEACEPAQVRASQCRCPCTVGRELVSMTVVWLTVAFLATVQVVGDGGAGNPETTGARAGHRHFDFQFSSSEDPKSPNAVSEALMPVPLAVILGGRLVVLPACRLFLNFKFGRAP